MNAQLKSKFCKLAHHRVREALNETAGSHDEALSSTLMQYQHDIIRARHIVTYNTYLKSKCFTVSVAHSS